ncbi:hypothetical protein RMATCC62417_12556 [Rhizopus microsporus]|nr:hypothetical protein RMATCC62417_12556 [Rhizopus microsporus]
MKRSNSKEINTTTISTKKARFNDNNNKQKLSEKIYGNYNAYYTSRRVPKSKCYIDPRIDMLDPELFKSKQILDIGCNTGNITIAIAKKREPAHILGVDIDESLIQKAENNIRLVYSLSNPNTDSAELENPFDLTLKSHHFPLSMTHMFGFIPMAVPPDFKETENFPYNVSFKAADWTKEQAEGEKYDTVLALSVTKWIQIHGGDDGLKMFFKKIYDCLKPGGTLVLESQEFGTYQRRAKHIDDSLNVEEDFQFRPENYTDYLINKVGFNSHCELGVPKEEGKGFARPVVLYVK